MTTSILDRLAAELTTLGVAHERSDEQIHLSHRASSLFGCPLFTLGAGGKVHCNSLPFGRMGRAVEPKVTLQEKDWALLRDRCRRIREALQEAEERIDSTRRSWEAWDQLRERDVPFTAIVEGPMLRFQVPVTPEGALALAPKLTRLLRLAATGEQPRIYTASRVRHAPKWKALRAAGFRITSTWIDEAEEGASPSKIELWDRCVREATESDIVIAYFEPGDPRVGALVEVGAALAWGVTVYVVNLTDDSVGSWVHHPKCTIAPDLAHAVRMMGVRFGVEMPALPEGLVS